MVTEKHTNDVYYLSLREKGKYLAHIKGFYVNRAVGCYSDNCLADGDFDAGAAKGQRAGEDGRVPVKLEAVDTDFLNVRQRP